MDGRRDLFFLVYFLCQLFLYSKLTIFPLSSMHTDTETSVRLELHERKITVRQIFSFWCCNINIRFSQQLYISSCVKNTFQNHKSVFQVYISTNIANLAQISPTVLDFLSSPIGELLDLTFKIFVLIRVAVIWFIRTITLESLNQSEPNFHI